jgi:hypothetical protein
MQLSCAREGPGGGYHPGVQCMCRVQERMASVWGKARLDARNAHLCECCHGCRRTAAIPSLVWSMTPARPLMWPMTQHPRKHCCFNVYI